MRSRTRGSRRADRRWGQYQTFRTTLRRPVHRYETANGLTSNDESVLIPLSARSDGLDDGDGSPERCVYIQMGGIEQVCIGGGLEGGRLALRIPLVAPQKVGQDLLPVGLHAAGLQLGDTTRGTHLRGGGDVELYVGRRRDNGPDIAAVQHRARLPCRESALIVQECRAHLRYGRHDRRGRGHGLCLQCIFVEFFRIERGSRGRGVGRIVGRMAGIEHRLGDGPIEQSRIQVMQAVMRGDPARQRAFAGRGRAVDGDDHLRTLPSRFGKPSGEPNRPLFSRRALATFLWKTNVKSASRVGLLESIMNFSIERPSGLRTRRTTTFKPRIAFVRRVTFIVPAPPRPTSSARQIPENWSQ